LMYSTGSSGKMGWDTSPLVPSSPMYCLLLFTQTTHRPLLRDPPHNFLFQTATTNRFGGCLLLSCIWCSCICCCGAACLPSAICFRSFWF
jgi:hypothetical protein